MSIDQLRLEGDDAKAEEHDRISRKFNTIVTRCISGKSLEDVLKEVKAEEVADSYLSADQSEVL